MIFDDIDDHTIINDELCSSTKITFHKYNSSRNIMSISSSHWELDFTRYCILFLMKLWQLMRCYDQVHITTGDSKFGEN